MIVLWFLLSFYLKFIVLINKANILISGWSAATGRVAAVAVVLVESKHPGVPRHDPARGRGRSAHGFEAALGHLLHGRPAVVQLGLTGVQWPLSVPRFDFCMTSDRAWAASDTPALRIHILIKFEYVYSLSRLKFI